MVCRTWRKEMRGRKYFVQQSYSSSVVVDVHISKLLPAPSCPTHIVNTLYRKLRYIRHTETKRALNARRWEEDMHPVLLSCCTCMHHTTVHQCAEHTVTSTCNQPKVLCSHSRLLQVCQCLLRLLVHVTPVTHDVTV